MLYIAFGFLLVAFLLFIQARRQRHAAGMPFGRIIFADTRTWGAVEQPIYDPQLGLVGKPDYLVEVSGGDLIPVEVKSSKIGSVPYDAHILQLAAYCLLVQSQFGKRRLMGSCIIQTIRLRSTSPLSWSALSKTRYKKCTLATKRETFLAHTAPLPVAAVAATGIVVTKDFCNIIVPVMPKALPEKTVLIMAHPKLPEAVEQAAKITDLLNAQGIQTETGLLYDDHLHQLVKAGEAKMVIALGGDGTMLRAGHLCGPYEVPLLGINLAGLVFSPKWDWNSGTW